MLNPIKKTIALPDGREITLETGKLAKQADGAVELRMGNTMLLATIVSAKEAGEGVDFMPLQVEYKEKYSAFGRYPGGFLKREGGASDSAPRLPSLSATCLSTAPSRRCVWPASTASL